MPAATQLKNGNIVILNNELFKIIRLDHITPGKGNAIIQAELRGVKSGVKTEKRFRSNENVETVEMITRKMQYLYEGDGVYHFMDNESYEQYEMPKDLLADSVHFLVPETHYEVDLYEGQPIGIELPARMTFKVTQTDPAEKGSAGKTKPATLQTGLVVKVPLFVETGDSIVVNCESGEYVERA